MYLYSILYEVGDNRSCRMQQSAESKSAYCILFVFYDTMDTIYTYMGIIWLYTYIYIYKYILAITNRPQLLQ